MTDAFVSYCRTDEAFARRLVSALDERGKSVWVDWEGIPPTAAWLEEIRAAIEASDSFVFLISDASLLSNVCADELAHAEEVGKRIVPVAVENVDPATLPSVLATQQWIVFFDGTPFERAADVLVEALDTDLEWVREHTRWLRKARDWERSGRDSSLLLRGSELRAAEAWLTAPGAAEKLPAATPLQGEYVLASRHAATRRQRVAVAVTAFALLVTAVLAVAALIQREHAVAERKTAESQLLASLSREQLASSPDTALLLAAAGYDIEKTVAARDAVLAAAQRSDRMARLLRFDGPVTAVATSGDGRLLATATTRTVAVEDLARGALVGVLAARRPSGIALDADGSRLAVVTGGHVRLHELEGENIVPSGRPLVGFTRVRSIAFGTRGHLLAGGTEDGRILLHDLETGRTSTIEAPPPRGVDKSVRLDALTFDPRGKLLVAASPFGPYLVTLGRSPEAVLRPTSDFAAVRSVAFAGASSLLVVTGDGRLLSIAPATGEVRTCGWRERPLNEVALVGGRVVVGARDGALLRLTRDCSRRELLLNGHATDIVKVAPGPERGQLLSVDEEGLAILWSPHEAPLVTERRTELQYPADVVNGFSPGDVVLGGDAGSLLVRGSRDVPLEGAPGVQMLAAARDAPVLAAAARPVVVWRGRRYARLRLRHLGSALSVALSTDGRILAVGRSDGTVELSELATGDLSRRETGSRGSVVALSIADSGQVAAGDTTGRLVLWDDLDWGTDNAQPQVLRAGPRDTVAAVAFAPGGGRLAEAVGNEVAIWDPGRGESHALRGEHREKVNDVDFSPSGRELVSADAQGKLVVWDVDAAIALGQPLLLREPIQGVDIRESDRVIVAVGELTGTIYTIDHALWDVDAARRRICDLVRRPLRDDEWDAVAPGLAKPATCGGS
jgi:WD40 repeat protein